MGREIISGLYKKIIVLILLAAVVAFGLGCISSPEKKPEQITTLRIGYQPTTHHLSEMAATEKGWWLEGLKPYGINEIKEWGYPNAGPELKAMQDGDLDVAYLCSCPFIGAIISGLDAKIVAGTNINGSNLVLKPGIYYDGPRSLLGLHIGTFPPGTAQDILLKVWLLDNGVNISEINFTSMAPGDAVMAMMEGKVDGVFLPQPAPAIIEMAGKGKSVLSSGYMRPNHACCGIIVSGKLIREHPELVDQILKIQINATEYINAHPEEAARIYSNRTGQDLNMVEYSIRTWDGKWISDPHLLINDTLMFAKFQYEHNYTQKELTEKDLFDTSFYDKLMEQREILK